jgi:hypothetical protein
MTGEAVALDVRPTAFVLRAAGAAIDFLVSGAALVLVLLAINSPLISRLLDKGTGPAATVAALLGGTLAATSHVAKATTRAAANTSPEPFSNIGLSLLGDGAVPVMLWLSWAHPFVFFGGLVLALTAMVALIWVFAKFLRVLARRFSRSIPVNDEVMPR